MNLRLKITGMMIVCHFNMYSIYAYPPPKKKEVMVKKKFKSETREEAFVISKSLQMEGYINVQICEIDRKR